MQKRVLALFAVLFFSCLARAEDAPGASTAPGDAPPPETAVPPPAAKKWYAGGAIGHASLLGWDIGRTDRYYSSQGYRGDYSGWLNLDAAIYHHDWKPVMLEGNLFIGRQLASFMNVELGYSRDDNTYNSAYTDGKGTKIYSERKFIAQTLHLAALFRPSAESVARGGPYLMLGAHASRLDITKSVTGNSPMLSQIAAGDIQPGDGTSRGGGWLAAVGFDIRIRGYGAVRLQYSYYRHLAGTQYNKGSWVVGGLGYF